MKHLFLLVLVTVAFISCGPSTKIEKSWVEPGATMSQSPDTKTLVIAMMKDETSRRVVEDLLVKRIKGKAEASYPFLTNESLKEHNQEFLDQKIKEGKFTHLLMVRLADIEKETSYVPGTSYYGGYGRYYGYGGGFYGSPGYYTTDKNYMVETTIYSINPDKLLWTGTTKTVNPGKMDKAVNEIADAVVEKMKKDGFLK
jgi:hypothetical protein